jgi:hypothetical protein
MAGRPHSCKIEGCVLANGIVRSYRLLGCGQVISSSRLARLWFFCLTLTPPPGQSLGLTALKVYQRSEMNRTLTASFIGWRL